MYLNLGLRPLCVNESAGDDRRRPHVGCQRRGVCTGAAKVGDLSLDHVAACDKEVTEAGAANGRVSPTLIPMDTSCYDQEE